VTEHDYLLAIDNSIIEAARLLELTDVADTDEDTIEQMWEDRHHCGTCTTRVVMETVWPSIENYINYVKAEVRAQ
jgi:hypothetical protein